MLPPEQTGFDSDSSYTSKFFWDNPRLLNSAVLQKQAKEMKLAPETILAHSMVLTLVRKMRGAATMDNPSVTPEEVLTNAVEIVDLVSRLVITELLDKDNKQAKSDLQRNLQETWQRLEPKYSTFDEAGYLKNSDGGLNRLKATHDDKLQDPYKDLLKLDSSWEKRFGFGSAETDKKYLIFAPLSGDFMEAYLLNMYLRTAYEQRNVEVAARKLGESSMVIIPNAEVIPVIVSTDYSKIFVPTINLTGNEIARPYIDASEFGRSQRATHEAIMSIDPNLLPEKYKELHGLL